MNASLVLGSERIALTTDPPWVPVAPKTTRTFFDAISVESSEILDVGLIRGVLLDDLRLGEVPGVG